MKLSLSWIFDHIDADWHTLDVAQLVANIGQTTAEIEAWYPLSLSVEHLTLARVVDSDTRGIMVESPEWDIRCMLPVRKDARVGSWYCVKKVSREQYAWATTLDIGGQKEHILPALAVSESLSAGQWKKNIEKDDYILVFDNKSITHRPDLWGHRGFAREIAALLQVPLKPLDSFLAPLSVQTHDTHASATKNFPIAITNPDTSLCKKFAGVYVPHIEHTPSIITMAIRLARVDAKAIDLIVDTTNYVMFDLSQPLHAFDAAAIKTHTIGPRLAKKGTTLALLDGQNIDLTADDIVIADGATPLALAGIMGGADSAVHQHTHTLFIEAACFDAPRIRRSALHHKIRTEASTRFEKSLDPEQTVLALKRAVYILKHVHPSLEASALVAVGAPITPVTITVTHDVIEKSLGISLLVDFVQETLTRLGFGVTVTTGGTYTIAVPSYRATKDVTIAQDIVEEVGRFYGYTRMQEQLPYRQMKPVNAAVALRRAAIKQHMAFAERMHEVYNYALFDEEWLRQLQWQPEHTATIQNPVSENWRRMVTSLIPHLIKNVVSNSDMRSSLRFFEWARSWHVHAGEPVEKMVLAGIVYEQKKEIDFYAGKQIVTDLCALLQLPITWHKAEHVSPWYMPHMTAHIKYNDTIIGTAGMVSPLFLHKVLQGSAFIFELNADVLQTYTPPVHRYIPVSKYPSVERDVSVLLSVRYTVADLITRIAQCDERITNVLLIDFFQKKEWHDKHSLTFRFTIQDHNKTLTTQEVEHVWQSVAALFGTLQGEVR